jgi:hypothetical protein
MNVKPREGKYKGVYHDKRHNTYDAYITFEGKRYYLGAYKTAVEAAKVYNKKALELHKEFANLNKVEEDDDE